MNPISYILQMSAGSAARSGNGVEEGQVQVQRNMNGGAQWEIQRIITIQTSRDTSAGENVAAGRPLYPKCHFSSFSFSPCLLLGIVSMNFNVCSCSYLCGPSLLESSQFKFCAHHLNWILLQSIYF